MRKSYEYRIDDAGVHKTWKTGDFNIEPEVRGHKVKHSVPHYKERVAMSGRSLRALGEALESRSKDIVGFQTFRRSIGQWILDFFDKLRGKEGTKIAHELRNALADGRVGAL